MIFEGEMSVISALKEKKKLQETGKAHAHIRPLVIVDGGLMKVAYSVGAGLAFEELGYTRVFSSIVGISSGAPSAAYFVEGNVAEGSKILYEDCCSKRFVNMWRFWNQADTRFIATVLAGSTNKALDAKKIFNSPTQLFIGVTEYETALPVLLKPATHEQLILAIRASILMANVSTDSVMYEGVRYVDGGFSSPHMVQKVINETDATHILVLTNQEKGVTRVGWFERVLNETFFRFRLSPALRKAARYRRVERQSVLTAQLMSPTVPTAVVWGNNSIGSFERDPKKIKKTIEASRLWWHELLRG